MVKDNSEQPNINTKVELFQYKSSIEDMDDLKLIEFLDNRFSDMSSATIRKNKELDWDKFDRQFTALSVRDQYGNLKVNLPMEQNLIDTYEGRNTGKLIFDIQPDWKQADIEELQPAKYAIEFYLEWWDNKGSWFYEVAPRLRRGKAKYWTAFAFVWLENNKQLKFKIKDWADILSIADLENKENYEPYILDAWEFFPKDLDIRSVYVDEKALNQPDIQKAEDCFVEKMMSLDKINFVRWKSNWYRNIDKLSESTYDEDKKNNKDHQAKNQVLIRFYYNSLSKDYIIYAPDNSVIIHKSKMLYNHWKLPIESVQHYSDDNCLYGIGICEKIKYLKWFKSEIMQSILDNAAMSSWLNFVIWNSWEIEDWNLWGNWINMWRTTVWAEQIQQLQPQINSWLISILNILDDLVVQDTWENVRAIIDMQTDKVGIVEMMEENKAIRHKSVDSNWNLFLDRILTMMLSNIAQFVPTLLCKTETIKQWKKEVTKIEYPYIRIKDAVVKKKNGKMIIDKEDNYGKLWYFELKPWSLSEWLWVKVVTPSSTNALPLIKKDAITKWIDNKLKLAQLAALDQTWQMMQKLQSTINFQELNDWINDVYWFEDKLKSKTGKDKIKDLNMKKVERIRAMLEWWVPTPEDWWQLLQNNQQPNVWQNTWVPMTDKDEEAWSTIEDIAIQDKQPEPEII
jgi:hypothetical protein